MRRLPTKLIPLIAICAALLLQASPSAANKLDLTVARFIECTADGSDCRAHNDAYERFLAEYAFGIAPKLMSPASTLGYSGFYLGVEASLMTLPKSGRDEFRSAAGNYQAARWRLGTGEYNALPPAMLFPTVHVRKGLPWSMEVGSSISYLAQSELVALGGEVKWSPFEGYRTGFRGALPDVAVKGAVNRVIGQTDLDMTIIGVDGSISYPFGIGGMISLEPYAGYQFLLTIVRTEPMLIRTGEGTSNIVFHQSEANSWDVTEANLTGPDLMRHKIFFGLVFRYELLAITMDWAFGLPQDWKTEMYTGFPISGTNFDTVNVHVDTQFAFSFGTALQF